MRRFLVIFLIIVAAIGAYGAYLFHRDCEPWTCVPPWGEAHKRAYIGNLTNSLTREFPTGTDSEVVKTKIRNEGFNTSSKSSCLVPKVEIGTSEDDAMRVACFRKLLFKDEFGNTVNLEFGIAFDDKGKVTRAESLVTETIHQ